MIAEIKKLSENELAVVKVMWTAGKSLTLSEIYQEYVKQNKKHTDYATVATFVYRARKKNVLKTDTKHTGHKYYVPSVSYEEYAYRLLENDLRDIGYNIQEVRTIIAKYDNTK